MKSNSNILKLNSTSFLQGLYFYVPILTLYFLDAGVGIREIVLAQLFYAGFTFLSEVPTGILADKFGQKRAISSGYLFESLALSLFLIFPTVAGLFIAYSIRGIAGAFLSGSEEALLFESTKQNKGVKIYQKIFANWKSFQILGFILSTLLTGIVLDIFGGAVYQPLILITIMAMLLCFIISLSLKNIEAKIEDPAKGKDLFYELKSSIKLITSNKTVLTLTFVVLLTLNGEYFMQSVYQPYFQDAGVTSFFIGSVLSFGAVLNYILLKNSYRLEKYFQLQNILLIINGALAILYVFMSVFIHPVLLVGVYILMQGLFNIQSPILSDYIHEHTNSSIRSTVISTISFAKQGSKFIARLVLGILVGAVSIKYTILVQGIYLAIGILLAYWLIVRCGCVHRIRPNKYTR